MATPGSAQEALQLADPYRRLADEELIARARQKESLTEAAGRALATEIVSRRVKVPHLSHKLHRSSPIEVGKSCNCQF
jgi:hypothetical protein